jgi:hypothetical protein
MAVIVRSTIAEQRAGGPRNRRPTDNAHSYSAREFVANLESSASNSSLYGLARGPCSED